MDSGASSSMFPSENAFRYLDYNNGIGSVMLGDNKLKLAIEGVGNSNLDILGRCYYVPRLSLGIISISQLTRNGELTNIVSGGVSNIIDEYGQVVLSATEHDGLYILMIIIAIYYMALVMISIYYMNHIILSLLVLIVRMIMVTTIYLLRLMIRELILQVILVTV